MKSVFRKLKNSPNTQHGLRAMAAQGVVALAAGLVMPREHVWIAVLGGTAFVLAVVLLVGAWAVRDVLEGEVIGEQQPQLTDVQAHMRRTPALPQGT